MGVDVDVGVRAGVEVGVGVAMGVVQATSSNALKAKRNCIRKSDRMQLILVRSTMKVKP